MGMHANFSVTFVWNGGHWFEGETMLNTMTQSLAVENGQKPPFSRCEDATSPMCHAGVWVVAELGPTISGLSEHPKPTRAIGRQREVGGLVAAEGEEKRDLGREKWRVRVREKEEWV